MTEREQLLKEYGTMSFAAHDILLFLDTHPFNAEALKAFSHYYRTARVLKNEYEMKYGPLTADASPAGNCWQWIDSPLPWEYKGGK